MTGWEAARQKGGRRRRQPPSLRARQAGRAPL